MQTNSTVWELVWRQLKKRFEDVADRVSVSNPNIVWQWGHDRDLSQRYPFTAFASAKRSNDPAADEELVISVDWRGMMVILNYRPTSMVRIYPSS
jgi:hypothetical protein